MSNWISNVEAEPGFFKNVFKSLESLDDDVKDCNLVLDGMSIREQILFDKVAKEWKGFWDFGQKLGNCDNKAATEDLFFMLVSLKHQWKLPIGYVLQNKCNATMQTTLVKTALSLSLAKDVGLRVHGVTFDGTATNLGCNVIGKYDQIKSSFEFEGRTYYVILDVCHMIKLARNCLGGLKEIRSSDGIISTAD